MKKVINLICLFLTMLVLLGCPQASPEKEVQSFVNKHGDDGAFLIKFNPTQEFFAAEDSGEFAIKEASRSVLGENDILLSEDLLLSVNNISTSNICVNGQKASEERRLSFYNDTLSINRKINEEIENILNKDSSRSVTSNVSITKNTYDLETPKDFFYISGVNSDGSAVSQKAEAVLKASNDYCNVWYIDNLPETLTEPNDENFSQLASKFESIYQPVMEIFGSHQYTNKIDNCFIDPCEKIDIIVCDISNDAKEDQNTGIGGIFYNADLFKADYIKENEELANINTNESQCIYIDSNFLSSTPEISYSTLVHEFTHLLNFCQKTIIHGQKQSTWFTEMMAMLSEDMCQNILEIDDQYSPKYRLFDFAIYYNYGFTDSWNYKAANEETQGKLNLIAYANTYAYGAYLVRNKGGFNLLKNIATSGYVDEMAVEEAILQQEDLTPKIENFITSALYLSQVILDVYLDFEENIISLNKEIVYSDNNELIFEPIELKFVGSDGTVIYPNIYNPDAQLDLGAYSFSLHAFNKSWEKVNFITDKNSPIESYLLPVNFYD